MIEDSFKKGESEGTERSCQMFIMSTVNTKHFSRVAEFMREFKSNQNKTNAFEIFINLHNYIKSTNNKALEDQFNRCLVPEAFIREESKDKPKSTHSIENNDNVHRERVAPPPQTANRAYNVVQQPYEEGTEEVFTRNIHGIQHFNRFAKVVYLYLKCIITLGQLKQFSARLLPKNLYTYFIEAAADIEAPRRNGSLFVSLNHLSDSELKNRIGASYVQMPSGYANHCNDHTLPREVKKTLNREWVSMPLGTEFKNTKKNQYEQEMFKFEEQRFEIDSTIISFRKSLQSLRAAEASNQFKHSTLLERVLYRVYGTGEVYDFFQRKPGQTAKLIYLRVQQKLREIENCRKKSIRTWDQAAFKNFQKSLDHRSFYFQSYEKKFNLTTARWDKETEFKHQFHINPATPNPQNFNTNLNITVDTFQNITKQKCIESSIVNLNFPDTESFIKFPQNKILYVFDFSDTETLNDVIGIISNKVNKKSTLQYLLLKLLKMDVLKTLEVFQENMKKFQKFKEVQALKNNDSGEEDDFVTTKKDRKKAPDVGQQFYDMIDEGAQYVTYGEAESPFQGPAGHVFIGTKTNYHFMRYLLVIYQRLIKAKQLIRSLETEDDKGSFLPGQRYDRLKSVLMSKSKDISLDQTMRKIFDKNAFMFLTLNKLIERASRIINNPDQVSASIIKADMRDYDCGIKRIDRFEIKSELEQLMRVYHQSGVFYRFCWASPFLYISSWSSIYKEWENKAETLSKVHASFNAFTSNPIKPTKGKGSFKGEVAKKRDFEEVYSEYLTAPNDLLLLQKGQEFYRSSKKESKRGLDMELKRLKRVKKILNI